jgi:hypothetical protein
MVVVDFAANCSSAKNTWICSQRPEKHAPVTTGHAVAGRLAMLTIIMAAICSLLSQPHADC